MRIDAFIGLENVWLLVSCRGNVRNLNVVAVCRMQATLDALDRAEQGNADVNTLSTEEASRVRERLDQFLRERGLYDEIRREIKQQQTVRPLTPTGLVSSQVASRFVTCSAIIME